MTGTSGNNGLLFEGTLAGVGTGYPVNYPGSLTTSVYGPNNLGGGNLAARGQLQKRRFRHGPRHGERLHLPRNDRRSVRPPPTTPRSTIRGSTYNYVHSTMGGLAVGNYDNRRRAWRG